MHMPYTQSGSEDYAQMQYFCSSGGTAYTPLNYTTATCYVPPCTAGQSVSSGTYDVGTSPNGITTAWRTRCEGGCEALYSGGDVSGRSMVGGVYHYFATGGFTLTGETCTSGDAVPSTGIPPVSCGPGQTLGTYNGRTMCLNSSTGDPVNPHTDSPPKESEDETVTNPDGSKTTTKTEQGPTGPVTTTTTCQPPDFVNCTTTKTGDDPLKDLCENEPSNALCSKSSFSGACTAGFTCEGDAAQCAAAKAVNELNCQFEPQEYTAADMLTAAGLTDAEATWKSQQNEETNIGGMLDFVSRSVPVAACPGPYTFTLPALYNMTAPVEISMDFICEIAEVVGNFLFLGACIMALRISVGA
jgi:hypothetical protein